MSKCHKCGSSNFVDSVRLEQCNDCGYYFYYGDAHAANEEDRLSSGSDYYRQRDDNDE